MIHIGIYTGTFDPIHKGHLAFAHQALTTGDIDRILFIPEAEPRGKMDVTPLAQRRTMLELAAADEPKFSVLELKSKQCSVAETLPELRQLFPDARFTVLVGSDIAAGIQDWPGIAELTKETAFIIGLRNPQDNAGREAIETTMKTLGADYKTVDVPLPAASSSAARTGGTVDHVPAEVMTYITEHKLYTPYNEAITSEE
jgi:nicotinate-nucleotide adenylyltransferase